MKVSPFLIHGVLALGCGIPAEDLGTPHRELLQADSPMRDEGEHPGEKAPLSCGNRLPYEPPMDRRPAAGLTLLGGPVVWTLWRALATLRTGSRAGKVLSN